MNERSPGRLQSITAFSCLARACKSHPVPCVVPDPALCPRTCPAFILRLRETQREHWRRNGAKVRHDLKGVAAFAGRRVRSERKHFSVSAVRMCGSRPSSLVRSDVREPLHAAAAFEGSFARRINIPGHFSPASGSYTRPRLLRLRYHL